jgi:hypothetical protein
MLERTGVQELDSQNRIPRERQQDRASRRGQSGKVAKDRTDRTGKPGQKN